MMNDFSGEHFQEELREELVPEKKDTNDEHFNSVLDFMEVILHKSFGMFDKMIEVLQNYNSSKD